MRAECTFLYFLIILESVNIILWDEKKLCHAESRNSTGQAQFRIQEIPK